MTNIEITRRPSKSSVMVMFLTFLLFVLSFPASAASLGNIENVAEEVATLIEPGQVGDMAFSADGRYLASESWGNGVTHIWDIKSKKIIYTINIGGTGSDDGGVIRFSPDGRFLAICHNTMGPKNIIIDIFETKTWQNIHQIEDVTLPRYPQPSCRMIEFAQGGKLLIHVSNTPSIVNVNNVNFYDTATWDVIGGLRTPFGIPHFIAIHPKGELVAMNGQLTYPASYYSMTEGERIDYLSKNIPSENIVVNTSTNAIVTTIKAHYGPITWNSDGTRIALGDYGEHAVKIFEANTGNLIASKAIKPNHLLLRYTSNGKYLIESTDKKVKFWDAEHNLLFQTIDAEPYCMTTSADSQYLALGGSPGGVLESIPLLSMFARPHGSSGIIIVYKLKQKHW